MAKIDRLGWADGICFKAYGWRIGIRVNRPEGMERVLACLPPGWEPLEPPVVDVLYSLYLAPPPEPGSRMKNYTLLYAGLERVARTLNHDEVYDTLEGYLQLLVAEWAKDRVFVHAGVVGWKGQAILLPGRSYSGKSTLVAALLRAGATYYSDEYAVLDSNGHVHPYARRLSLRQADGAPTRRCSAEELGGRCGTRPLPVGLVALSRYREGARWQPRRLTAGKALMELLDNTVPVMRQPEMAVTALQQVVPRSVNVKGLRGEAEETAAALLQERRKGTWS